MFVCAYMRVCACVCVFVSAVDAGGGDAVGAVDAVGDAATAAVISS